MSNSAFNNIDPCYLRIAEEVGHHAPRLLRLAASNGFKCEGITIPAKWAHPPGHSYSTKTVVMYLFDDATGEDGHVAFTIYSDRGARKAGRVGHNAPIAMRTAMGWRP